MSKMEHNKWRHAKRMVPDQERLGWTWVELSCGHVWRVDVNITHLGTGSRFALCSVCDQERAIQAVLESSALSATPVDESEPTV